MEAPPFAPGDACLCGGELVEVGVDVLKALLPLFPEESVFMFRVWKVENGIPVALGVSSTCLEGDIIRIFHQAFDLDETTVLKLRAIDQNHQELGTEMTLHIPPGHPVLVSVRSLERSIRCLTTGTLEIGDETRSE